MRNQILVAASAALLALASCTGKSLSDSIEGSWQGKPQSVPTTAEGIMTMTDSWTFVADEGSEATGGSLVITSQASLEWPLDMAAYDSIAPGSATYAVSVPASISINATWDVSPHDDDEIEVSVDPRTLSVSIDPDGVAMSSNGNPAVLDSIPEAIYASARNEIVSAAQARFFPLSRLEDVEIKGNSLKFEIPPLAEGAHDTKVVLTRQGPVGK